MELAINYTTSNPHKTMPADVSLEFDERLEAELVFAARHDLACFVPIYDHYAPRIYLYCLRRVGSSQEAEDLTSMTFTRALGALTDYRGGSIAAWLFSIARHAIADYYRETRIDNVSLDQFEDVLPDFSSPPVEQLIHDERCVYLHNLIATFSTEEQELLALSISGELTSEEIGVVIGKKASTVRMRIHRLLKRLRASYAEEFV
jgi:RNA polymerase sigma-70 factor (ECF subfamily)